MLETGRHNDIMQYTFENYKAPVMQENTDPF